MDPEALAQSFGAVAEQYARYRPMTPPEALDWLVPAGVVDVLDLAAGTGALTQPLAALPLAVTAVEPDASMRAVLARVVPDATVLAGHAESIPCDDAGFDAVYVASAWHWLEPAVAVPEIARVLRDGGLLGVLGTTLDRDIPWVGGLPEVDEVAEAEHPPRDVVAVPAGAPFDAPETTDLRWVRPMTIDMFMGLLGTYSGAIVATPHDREHYLERSMAYLDEVPRAAGSGELAVPMRTWMWRARRHPRGHQPREA